MNTYGQLADLKGTLVKGFSNLSYSPCGRFVGILTQDTHNKVLWHLNYRYIKDEKVKGHKFLDSICFRDQDKQEISHYNLSALEENDPLRQSWNEAERRESLRKTESQKLLKPFENILEKVRSSDFLSLIPEMPLGGSKRLVLSDKIILSRKMFRVVYNTGSQGCLGFLGLDTLASIENFVKEEALNQGLSFRHSRLSTQGNCLKHEFFFD